MIIDVHGHHTTAFFELPVMQKYSGGTTVVFEQSAEA